MATRIDANGYILNADGRVDKTVDQSKHAEFKKYIEQEWKKNNPGKDVPPPDQTIVLVEKGDCLWTIAEEAGADPVTTAYQINDQFQDNPDLIFPGEIVFVDQSRRYAHSDTRDNTDMFADQTYHHTTDGTDPKQVRSDAGTYMASLPAPTLPIDGTVDPTKVDYHEQALQNVLLHPSWDDNSEKGQAARRLVVEEYLKLFPKAAQTGPNREVMFNELKVTLGLAKKSTDADGNVEYVDKTRDEIQADLSKEGLQGEELKKAVDNRVALLKNVNDGYNNVKDA
jgi:hypothetical protein